MICFAYPQLPISSTHTQECLRRGLRDFSPQGLSNMAWSYATLGHFRPDFLQLMADEGTSKLDSFSNQVSDCRVVVVNDR